MKNQIFALALVFMTMVSFAQKKELKTAEKAIKKQDYATAITAINSIESIIENADGKTKAKYYFLKGQAYSATKKYEVAGESFNTLIALEKKIKSVKYTNKAVPMLNEMINETSNRAINLYKAKDFKNATNDFYLTYVLSPNDTSFLFNAAVSASIAKDLDLSLSYYRKLMEIGYDGMVTSFVATSIETGEEVVFGNKTMRDFAVKAKSHNNPKDKNSESKKISIIKDIANILSTQGKIEEAVVAIKKARNEDPSNLNLLLTEADFYVKLNKMDEFTVLMKEAVVKDPNNATLYFNLGVVYYNQKKMDEAKNYYLKAIEIQDDYTDAYMNLAILILDADEAIVDEMNKNLSNDKKYNELAKQQLEIYRDALPYIEKADSLKRSIDTVRTLLNIYDNLEMDEKSKEFRALYKAMRQ